MLRVHKDDVCIRAIIDTFDDRKKDKKDLSNKMSDEDFWKTILAIIEQTQLSIETIEIKLKIINRSEQIKSRVSTLLVPMGIKHQ
jgi:predicted FMN-binding regulatory protein PaiB